jgi:hypothetical protein
VLCRLYHKKNEWEKMQQQKEDPSHSHSSGDTRTPESEVDDADQLPPLGDILMPKEEVHDLGGAHDWLAGINLDDMQGLCPMPAGDDFYSSVLLTPTAAKADQGSCGADFFF